MQRAARRPWPRLSNSHYHVEIAEQLCVSLSPTSSADAHGVQAHGQLREFDEDSFPRLDRRDLERVLGHAAHRDEE